MLRPATPADQGLLEHWHRAPHLREALGRGYGTQMMNLAIERSFADPSVTAILVDPMDTNPRAHRFYERLGFEYVVCRRFGEDSCFVYRLRRPGTATRDS